MSIVNVGAITSMAKLQDELNTAINPNWPKAGQPWHRAVWIEAAELLEHLGWKWWKKQEPNLVQAQIEVVDIWHFVLSDYLVRHGIKAGIVLSNEINDPEHKICVYKGAVARTDELSATERVEVFASLAASGTVNAHLFNMVRESVGLSWANLERLYLAKNALNIFRQRNGYKEGRYIKHWGGVEDNVVLERILATTENVDFPTLMALLNKEYMQVVAKEAMQ